MRAYAYQLMKRWDLHPLIWNLIIIITAIVVGLLIRFLIRLVFKKKQDSSGKFIFFQSFFRNMARPLGMLLPILVFDLLLPLLQGPPVLLGRVAHGTEIALILSFSWTLIRFMYVMQDFVHYKVDISKSDNLRQRRIMTQLMYVRRVSASIIIIITIGAVLLTFATMRKIGTGLLTGVGVGGIIIGFAAQRSLANLLAGFQIAFTQPIRIDDQVVVKNEFGTVEEITLTYVVIKIWDERRLILPINYFIEQPFENWTRTTANMMGTVMLYVDFNMPVEPLRQTILDMIKDHPLWDKRVSSVAVTDIRDRMLEIRILVSASNAGKAFDLRCDLRERIVAFISENYPQYLPRVRTELVDPGGMKRSPEQNESSIVT